jgi:V/A-type H+-transporting ATPase subunit I
MFRPAALNWIEVLIEAAAAPRVFDVLARAGAVELQRESDRVEPFPLTTPTDQWRRRLRSLESLRNRYRAFLAPPRADDVPESLRWAGTAAAVDAIEIGLNGWTRAAAPLVEQRRQLGTELEELTLLVKCLGSIGDMDTANLRSPAVGRYVPWLAMGPDSLLEEDGDDATLLVQRYPADADRTVYMGLVDRAELPGLERRLHGLGARFARVPEWLAGTRARARKQVEDRMEELRREDGSLADRLHTLNREWHTAGHLWLLERHRWLGETLDAAWQGKHFVLVTGWAPRHRIDELQGRLTDTGVPFLFRAQPGDGHGPAPLVLDNPRWIKPFELFVRGFGIPDRNEVDPSPVLALVTPLMFGYMFGDVGQGLALLLAGVFLSRRFAIMKLFIPAGLMAMVFGFLFGSVFCDEHLLKPLWQNPLAEPLPILVAPLGLGAALLALSILFDGVAARWAGRTGVWWQHGFPLLLLFAAPVCWFVAPMYGLAALIAAVGFTASLAVVHVKDQGWQRVLAAPLLAWLELLEAGFQLGVNTLSFARVGAFALAHAGLASAVISLASLADNMVLRIGVLVLGNIVIIGLEGLIVSIQTTRLVLFEFFRRFVRGEGRAFRPLVFESVG